MVHKTLLAAAGLCGVLLANPSRATVIQAGVDDHFAPPSEPASPSSQLVTLLGSVQAFDLTAGVNGGAADSNVAHTFTGLPSDITSATLEIRVRGGANAGVNNDGIFLSFVTPTTTNLVSAIAWRRTFGPFAGGGSVFSDPDLGLQPIPWASGSEAFYLFDLAALPLSGGGTVNILPQINQHGFLDVTAGDETAVDFVRLTYPVPEPASLLLTSLLGSLLLARRGAKASSGITPS